MKNVTITEACRGGGGGGGGGGGSYISSLSVFVASLILGFAITVAILAEGGCLSSRFHTGAPSLLFEWCRLSEFTLAGPHSKASSSRTSAPSESHHYILQDSFFHGHSWPLTSRSQTDLSPLSAYRKHPLLHPLMLSRGLIYLRKGFQVGYRFSTEGLITEIEMKQTCSKYVLNLLL